MRARLLPKVGPLCLGAALLAVCVATLSTDAIAEESNELVSQFGKIYLVNLDQVNYPSAAVPETAVDLRPKFGVVTSPSGVLLPDVSTYFDLDGDHGEVTYFTPTAQGLQLSLSGDRGTTPPTGLASGDGMSTQKSRTQLKSVGASFAHEFRDVEISLGGDYGRTPKSVPGAVRLVEDHKLLRLGAHARIQEFAIGGSFGSDIDPRDLAETLSWDAFTRYDIGSLSLGFVYNYTIEMDDPKQERGGIPGTFQAGLSYSFTPRMAVTTNLAYGSYVNEDGSDDSGMAGVLSFSLDF